MRPAATLLARVVFCVTLSFAAVVSAAPALHGGLVAASDDAHARKAQEIIKKGVAFLKSQQDKASGGWNVPKPAGGTDPAAKGDPAYPAITALALQALLASDQVKAADPAVAAGLKYLLDLQQLDGGIYDRVLPSYNTSISLSALAKINTPEARAAIPKAQEFLRKLQFSESSVHDAGFSESPIPVSKDHPFYGGVGYGRHGRPDASNLNMMMQAMADSGVSPDDPAVQRALIFLARTQMLGEVNDQPYAKGSKQGGFIYATAPNAESVEGRVGQTQATSTIEETMDDGTKVSRLRAYGSMSYAGFKTYIYAQLPKDDIRVRAVLDWIRKNYTLTENPGVGSEGMYYYYVALARALHAWGDPTINTIAEDGSAASHNWADDLIDHLATLQNEDGSFKSLGKRWMEDRPVLITAYALIALGEAEKMERAAASPAIKPVR